MLQAATTIGTSTGWIPLNSLSSDHSKVQPRYTPRYTITLSTTYFQ